MKIIYKLGDRVVSVEEFREGAPGIELGKPPMTANTYTDHDPLISEALGCMKSQVPAMRKLIESEKVQGVRILDSGQARITSRSGRNHLMKLLTEIRGNKYHDIDGGYGDH